MSLAISTKSTYDADLKRLNTWGINNFEDYVSVFNLLSEKNLSESSQKKYLSAIIYFLRSNVFVNNDVIKIYTNRISEIGKNIQQKVDKNILSKTEEQNYLSWNEILTVYEKVKQNSTKNRKAFKQYFILSLYVLHPPRRLEYLFLHFAKNKSDNMNQDFNYYILLPEPRFLFYNYKTFSKYGAFEVTVEPELIKIIDKYIDIFDLNDGDAFFSGKSKTSFVSSLNKIFETYAQKTISVNLLRHSFISHFEQNGLFKTVEIRKKIAQLMGHDIVRQLEYNKHSVSF